MTMQQVSRFKRLKDKNGPCRKLGQGHPRVFIYINLIKPESPMLHAKFQNHSGSGEEEFLRFSPYMGMAAILVM